MVQLTPPIVTNDWVDANWDAFLAIAEHPDFAKAKAYYFNAQMRIETMGVGPDHASDNGIVHVVLTLFCALRGIPLRGFINASYRKPKVREAQPDLSYYVGDRTQEAPEGRSIVNLETASAPDLAIEIADSSLNDDLGKKRLLYEELGIREYWIIDVEKAQVLAFQIEQNGSRRIQTSQVIPGLSLAQIQAALDQCRSMDDSQVVVWAMQAFQ